MALNFPDAPTNNQVFTDATTGEQWKYETSTNSWTSLGLTTSGGIVYKGGLSITAAPPAGVASGWTYTVTTGGTPNAGFTGLTGTIAAGSQVVFDGANWQVSGSSGPWTRAGTTLSPAIAGDAVDIDFPLGTAALPGLTPVGDPNTGIYSPGADRLSISTGGTERVAVTAAGRVGIGTTSPATALHVSGTGTQRLRITGTGAANAILSLDAASTYSNYIEYGVSASTPLYFRDVTAGADRMVIDTAGRVLVGKTTATANGGDLQVSKGITFPATAVACTDPNTLDDYEEGTWTPTQGAALTVVGAFSSSGTYVKVGNVVHLFGKVSGATSVAAAASGVIAGGAPYPIKGGINGVAGGSAVPQGNDAGAVVQFTNTSFYARATIAATPTIYFSATYEAD